MADYKRMYVTLFNAVTDALELLEADDARQAEAALQRAQIRTEEIYCEEPPARRTVRCSVRARRKKDRPCR